ncbi:MAG: type II secretion system protein GspG, partial [Caulobacterales bacterium]|nr:type II secretion system protein GspG [Caulobacterales bacterium]
MEQRGPAEVERRRRAQAGFTLTEMMVVIVLIGLVSSMVGFAAFRFLAQGRADVARINVERLATSLEMFKAQTGRYPTTEEGLDALVMAGAGGEGAGYQVLERV